MTRPEILAPAGSFDALRAACACGADAVYLGGKTLNARRNAGNFDEEELARAVSYCHVRGVRVYQTLNTVLFDEETDELLAAAETAARLGIDGAIVQDLGVLALLRECVPDLPRIASTQMAVHNLAGALEAERLGCSVVVLARELTAAEIGRITCALTTAKTEVFVHGALCMSVSGQCYLSSMLGGRSGNRGLCAQPCRLPFSAGKSTHALSLKDLSLVERVGELAALGVSSLKIEGRMKRPEYVAAAVTAVRQALDGERPDLARLRSVFSRSGFTSGYFDGRRGGEMFGTRQKEDVTAAKDVLGELARLAVRETPRVPLDGRLSVQRDEPSSLTVHDADGHHAEIFGPLPLIAENRPTDAAKLRQSMEKTGGTPFYWKNLDISVGEGLLLPASAANALRREALCRIEVARAAPRPLSYTKPAPLRQERPAFSKTELRARCTAAQLTPELLALCGRVTVPLFELDEALKKAPPERLAAEIPRILFEGEEQVADALAAARKKGVAAAWCGNIGAVHLAREADMTICGGWPLNLTNTRALKELARMGAQEAELSFELSLSRQKKLGAPIPFGLLVYGRLPLMVYRNCPMKAAAGCKACGGHGVLTDRTGTKFSMMCGKTYAELLNSVPLYLADRLGEYGPAAFYTLWFTTEKAEDCARIAAEYAGKRSPVPPERCTRGLYTRSVL